MKARLLTILLLAVTLGLSAKPQFQAGKKYQIMCQRFPDGTVALGSEHGQTTPVYYLPSATTDADTYWYFKEVEPGKYAIQNVSTGQYITYTGEYSGNDIRYVSMTASYDEEEANKSFWTVTVADGNYFTIRNAYNTDHVWDVREDSYVVGTHTVNNDNPSIQRFAFYDEGGNLVEDVSEAVSGYDVSSWLVATTNGLTKWDNNGWSMAPFGDYHNEDAYVVYPFCEKWVEHGSNLPASSLSQTLQNLPAGDYTLQADMIAVQQSSNTPGTGVYLFVGNQTASVGTYDETPQRYTIDFTISSDGSSVTLGARTQRATANWVAIDNVTLYYHATETELIAGELSKLRADAAATDKYTTAQIEAQISATGQTFSELETLRKYLILAPDGGPLSRCASDITVKGRTPIYVESLGLYLCSISEKHFGTNFTDTIAYTPLAGYGQMQIDGTTVPSGSTYTFPDVSAGKTYEISFSNGSETVTYPLTFTSLPIVRINGDFNNTYSRGYITVCQPNKKKAELLNMKAKWRGGITNNDDKHKRNYHVKFLDDNGNKLEKRYFDLRKDNSWILESCQVDMGRIRNRVLTDLWNDYRTDPYYIAQEPEALTGTRGEFVELILDDDYRGIYCMTENMDRKQMKLKKYDTATNEIHGQLWKSKDWTYATLMGTEPDSWYEPKSYLSNPDENSEEWDKYSLKYPDLEDVSPTDWTTLYNAVDFVCHASDEDFEAHVAEYFDLPVVVDYYILMETILSTDNHGKNMFFGVYDKQVDKKITFGVWDMDATSGQRWSDEYYHNEDILGPEQDYAAFIADKEHGDYNLFKRLRDTDAESFNQRVAKRYRDLRQTYLATSSILQRFRTYFQHFQTAGADQREYARWNGDSDIAGHTLNFYDESNTTDMDIEFNYITDWFTRRMNYLDTTRFGADLANLPANGDVDNDGRVTTADAQAIANYILRRPATGTFNDIFADVNGDGRVTIADVTAAVNIALGR